LLNHCFADTFHSNSRPTNWLEKRASTSNGLDQINQSTSKYFYSSKCHHHGLFPVNISFS